MRILICVGLLALVSGCATTGPKLNCDESCAMQNMACSGQSMGETSGASVNLSSLSTTASNSSNLTFHCAKDEKLADKISDYRKSADVKIYDTEMARKCHSSASVSGLSTMCDEWRARRAARNPSSKDSPAPSLK